MSYHYVMEVQCDTCGMFEIVWRDPERISRRAGRAKAKAGGWHLDQPTGTHTCPICVREGQFKLAK